jgi:hypothetical protein
MTLARVSSETLPPGVIDRETAAWDTPAKRATSICEASSVDPDLREEAILCFFEDIPTTLLYQSSRFANEK